MYPCRTESIIEQAEIDTSVHLRYLRSNIRRSLLFTLVIIFIDIINVATSTVHGRSAEYIRDLLYISPNPILLIALVISAGIQLYLLIRIKVNYSEIKCVREQCERDRHDRKSITDINYDMIKASSIALKTWPVIAFLFVIYFIGCLSMLVELVLGIGSEIALNSSTALNLVTVIISVYFFTTQTVIWRAHRKKMKGLEMMEKQVLEELNL